MLRSIALSAVLSGALLLGGCADLLGQLGQPVEANPPAGSADQGRVDAQKVAADAICGWAKSAGVPDLSVSWRDSAETKRKVAALVAAHQSSCPAPTGTTPASPPGAQKPPEPKKG